MSTEAGAQIYTQSQSNSTAFLFKSLKRLYIYAQFLGGTCFSYSHSNGRVYVTSLNVVVFVIFAVIYMIVGHLNLILEKTNNVTGYQAILFWFGEKAIPSYSIFYMWILTCVLFLLRKKFAKLMFDLMTLDYEVCENYRHKFYNCFQLFSKHISTYQIYR